MENKFQEDFPIDWVEDDYVTRREFFKFITLTSGGLALSSVGLAAWASVPRRERAFEPQRLTKVSELQAGQALAFNYPRPNDPCILVRDKAGLPVAYSRRCTHLSCPVVYQPEHGRLYCPCHNGAFAIEDGRVLQGPPPRPLVGIKLEVRGEDIYALGVKEI